MAGAGKTRHVTLIVQGEEFVLHEDETMANVITFFKFNSDPYRFAEFKLIDGRAFWVKPSEVGVIYATEA